jgi:aminoethylphosphonate catabolism LysR family transcriptional regulator
MRYVQLRAFHHVAVCGGFSRAAALLNLTQPAISDQVRRLEAEYDLRLFDRSRKQVALTAMGERLLAVTRRLFESEKAALELLGETRALRTGELRIVADAAHHLLGLLARFRERYPGVRVVVRSGNSAAVAVALAGYEAEIGVTGERPAGDAFETVSLGTTPIVAFVARGSPLARRAAFGFADLARLPLVLREEGSRTRQRVVAAARDAGVALEPAIEAEGREAVREIVASGAGLGFVSRAEFGHDARLVAVPVLPDEGLMMEEVLVALRERAQGKLVRAFLDLARA